MSGRFVIKDAKFSKDDTDYGSEEYLTNWPMLYILENGKEAYIGESNNVATRMSQHLNNQEKNIFNKVHFIYSKEFNQSVTFDYESKLINCFASDKKFIVTNKNGGISDKNYYDKKIYEDNFSQLWRKLQDKDVALATHSLDEIKNSVLFKYSPFKELNNEQRIIVEDIVNALQDGKTKEIIINGMPGTGKTIVALYLIKFLIDAATSNEEKYACFKDLKIGFVVPQEGLRGTMKEVFKNTLGLNAKMVLGPSDATKEMYDILVVDEAHRLHRYKNISYRGTFKENCIRLGMDTTADELDWILHQSKHTIIMYDQLQCVGPSGIEFLYDKPSIAADEKNGEVLRMTLKTQMRVAGGIDYISYVQNILSGTLKNHFSNPNYELKLYKDFSQFEKDMYEKEKKYGLTRMIAGYAWPWISKKDKSLKDIEIQGIKKMWNHKTKGWVSTKQSINEVGCIHSIQGYDLNYAFVILGKDIGYDVASGQVIVYPDNYYDKNGKNTTNYEDLLYFIRNIYYVLLTRGMKGTYIYVCDDAYREYLSKYIEVVK